MTRPAGAAPRIPLRDLVAYFLRLGAVGFGGPVALIGQMETELVRGRGWVSAEEFRDGLAVCQSLPGPLAIQVGIFIAYIRGGFWGAWAGGWAFILPNFLFVTAMGALYAHIGGLSLVKAVFYGVSPAIIALIFFSCYRLARLGMGDPLQWFIAAGCFAVTLAVQAEVALLFLVSGAIGIAFYGTPFRGRAGATTIPLLATVAETRMCRAL
jgi:chromate transporter